MQSVLPGGGKNAWVVPIHPQALPEVIATTQAPTRIVALLGLQGKRLISRDDRFGREEWQCDLRAIRQKGHKGAS